jgi:hypothetical protein
MLAQQWDFGKGCDIDFTEHVPSCNLPETRGRPEAVPSGVG